MTSSVAIRLVLPMLLLASLRPVAAWARQPDDDAAAFGLPDTLTIAVQRDLQRLAYYRGDIDGAGSPGLQQALLAFERDEGAAPDAEPTPALLALTRAAVARIPAGGSCADTASSPGVGVACGSIR